MTINIKSQKELDLELNFMYKQFYSSGEISKESSIYQMQ